MAKSKQSREDDFHDTRVQRLIRFLDAGVWMSSLYEKAALLGSMYYNGQHWQRQANESTNAAAALPQLNDDHKIHPVANAIPGIINQWASRLRVTDFSAAFGSRDPYDERSNLATRSCQKWWDTTHPFSRLSGWYYRGVHARLLTGASIGRYTFDERRPGGVGLTWLMPGNVIMDPLEQAPDVAHHERVAEINAMSVAKAKEYIKGLGKLETEAEIDLDDAALPLATLISTNTYIRHRLYTQTPGMMQSAARGVLLYTEFDEEYHRMRVFLHNPKTTEESRKQKGKPASEWFILADKKYDGFCPYLHLNGIENPQSPIGISLAVQMVPAQALRNICLRAQANDIVASSHWRWLAVSDSLVNPQALRRGNGQIVWVKKRYGGKPEDWPQPLRLTRVDTSVDALVATVTHNMKSEIAQITETMEGQAVARGQAASAYELLLKQGSTVLRNMAQEDYERTGEWTSRMAQAAIIHYGRNWTRAGNSRRRTIMRQTLGDVVDQNLSYMPSLVKVLREKPATATMRQRAFSVETPEEVEARFEHWVTAGRLNPQQLDALPYELYELTGHEMTPGIAEGYTEAEELVRRVISGEPYEIKPFGEHYDIILRVVKRYLATHRTRGRSPQQQKRLMQLYLVAQNQRFINAQMEAAQTAMASGGGMEAGFMPESEPMEASEQGASVVSAA